MSENKNKIEDLRNLIRDNPESFPIIAQYWDIKIDFENLNNNSLEFGKYNASHTNSVQFYKPISKLIDFHKFKNE